MSYDGYWSRRTVANDVLLSFNFAVVIFDVFSFPPTETKLIGFVLINRQNAAKNTVFLVSMACGSLC